MLATTACYTSHTRTPLAGSEAVFGGRRGEAAAAFRYQRARIEMTDSRVGVDRPYEHRLLQMPSAGDNNQPGNLVSASYYRSMLPGSHPLVIVLPIWGTYTYPSRKIAKFIRTQSAGSVHVLHVHGERYLIDWERLQTASDREAFLDLWRAAAERQRVTVIDLRRIVDWTEQRPEIDSDRIGVIGFSFAATVAATMLSQEPRVSAAVLAMGGALQHTFLARCSGRRLTAVRERIARDFQISVDEFEALLEPVMRAVDPATYPGRVDPRGVLIIDAARDDCMPEPSRRALWQAMGRPERLLMDYNHRAAFYALTPLGLNWMRAQIWEFLEPRLLTDAAPGS